MPSFHRLIRFRAQDDQIYYGEAPTEANQKDDFIGLKIRPYSNNPLKTEKKETVLHGEVTVVEVLSPIPEVPIFYGIGLNYRQHAIEAKYPIPTYPVVFTKPSDALAGPFEDIPIGKELTFLDYEGELCVLIGKDIKDLQDSENPLDYVLGYMVGNDVSSRWWQSPERSGGQHGYAKSFDKFAPLGPVLVSSNVIQDPSVLELTTLVNGELRQQTKLDDLIFDVPTIIRHLSRGTTLRKGTVIMTGTPSGVAAFMTPPQWLKDGDVVEVKISEIGAIKNRMKFLD